MAEPPIPKPNATTYSLEDIVQEVLNGRVRIPEFQRSFRWQWEDVRRLVESIVRGYPIGSLLLWSRPAEQDNLQLGALTIPAAKTDEALWVVDGQQRLTSLANALSDEGASDPRFSVAYDLEEDVFCKISNERPHAVPLPVLFDLQRLLRWFADHPEASGYFDEGTRVAKAIRQYAIPAYIVKQRDEDVLRDIFDRMNNYGKRLTRAEVFSALHAGKGQEGPPRTFGDIVDHIDTQRGFGRLDEDTVLRAVLARRGPDVTREIRNEFGGGRASKEFPNEAPDEAYRLGDEALTRAVAFLQIDAGVPHFGFLTYRYLLVVLTRFFAHHPAPSPRNRELLKRWFWRAALVGPEVFRGWTEAMRILGLRVQPGDESGSVQSLLDAVSSFSVKLPPIGRFRSTSAHARMLLCALWSLEPRSVLTAEPYDLALLAQSLSGRRTAIDVIYTILKREPDGGRARAANRCILLGDDTAEDARSRFANPPLDVPQNKWTSVLESHGLNDDIATLLSRRDYPAFLSEREALLASVTKSFLAKMTATNFEDTPPLDTLDMDEDDDDDDDDNENESPDHESD